MKQKELLVIAVTLFLTVIGWAVSDIYHLSVTQQVTEIDPRFNEPIQVEIPVEVFEILEAKQQ